MAAEKPTPPFDTFVFDVDGTLLDTLDDLVVLTNDALAEFNLPPRTREEINSYVGNGVKALMYQAVPEGTPQDVADACLARWKENYGTYPNDLTKPYPGHPRPASRAASARLQAGRAVEQVRWRRAVHHEQVSPRRCGCAAWGRRPAELPTQARPHRAAHHH